VTPEEISRLPVGALVRAGPIFYLVYDRRIDPETGRPYPLVMVIDWVVPSLDRISPLPPPFPGQRLAMDVFVPDFAKAQRIA
jgi:hypothetical protein